MQVKLLIKLYREQLLLTTFKYLHK